MGRGPHKPTELRALEGGRSHSLPKPEDVKEPKPDPVVGTTPPKEIDTRAKKIWNELAPVLERCGLLTEADLPSFAILCQMRSFIFQIQDDVRQLNLFDDKAERLKELRQLYQQFRVYANDFGMTPRGRAGLVVGGSDGDDDDDKKRKLLT